MNTEEGAAQNRPQDDAPAGTDSQTELAAGWFIYTIKQLELGLRSPLEKATQEAGLTAAQFTALSVLARWPGLTSSELARRSFVRAQTMAETMTPLLEAGYVRRQQDPTNGRRFLLFLTESGHTVLDSIRGIVSSLESKLLSGLSPAEREMFAGFLRSCRSKLTTLVR